MKAVLLALLLFAVPAFAGDYSSRDVETAIRWVTTHSGYSAPWFARPTIKVVSDAELQMLACHAACGIEAAVLWDEPDTIYMSEDIEPDRRLDVLIHETTHWLQMRSGWAGKPSCSDAAAHEAEAYAIQYMYRVLVEHTTDGFWMPNYRCESDE